MLHFVSAARLVISGTFLASLLLPVFAFGQCCNTVEPNHGSPKYYLVSGYKDEICSKGMTFGQQLGLTKEQYDRLSALRVQYRSKVVQTVQQAKKNYEQLSAALSSHPIDTKTALAMFQRASSLSLSLNETYVNLCVQAGNVFTEQQRQKLQKLADVEATALGQAEETSPATTPKK